MEIYPKNHNPEVHDVVVKTYTDIGEKTTKGGPLPTAENPKLGEVESGSWLQQHRSRMGGTD